MRKLTVTALSAGVVVLAVVATVGGISCSTEATRSPSGREAPSFNALDGGGSDLSSEKLIAEGMSDLQDTYFYAQAQVEQFDSELKEAVQAHRPLDLASSPTYARLMAAREMSEGTRERVARVYSRLLTDPSRRPVVNRVQEKFKKINGAVGIALRSLARRLKTAAEDVKESSDAFDHLTMEEPHEFSRLMEDGGVRSDYRRLVKEATKVRTRMSQKIEQRAANMFAAATADRFPQANGIGPSTGPNGTVTGNTYPAGTWSLTFDDGPSPYYTQKVLDNLKAHNFRATFFELAGQAEQFPSYSKLVLARGMDFGNHSYTHPQLSTLDDDGLYHEIVESKQVLENIWGKQTRLFRCPYGDGSNVRRVRQVIADQGMINIFWNVDTLDWQDPNPDSIVERANQEMESIGHGVILFHDIHPQSVEASRILMDQLRQRISSGEFLRVVPVNDVIDEQNAH